MIKNVFWDEISIITNNFKKEEQKAAKFKGKIKFIYDSRSLVIRHFYYELQMCEIDSLTTQSWFESKTTNFRTREEVFSFLGLSQKPRPFRSEHDIVELDWAQLKKLNNYLKHSYKSTIKNFIPLIRGSNPSGELLSPDNAPIILEEKVPFFKSNFSLFFTNFFEEYEEITSQKEEIFANEKMQHNYFKLLQEKAQNPNSKFSKILEIIKYLSNPNLFNHKRKEMGKQKIEELKKLISTENIEKLVQKSRQRFTQNVEKFSNKIFDFSYTEKAHIWPVSDIKNKLIEIDKQHNNEKQFLDYLKAIEDFENYLNLTPNLHTAFDKYWFTFDEETGRLKFKENNKKTLQFKEEISKNGEIDKILQIPLPFLTKNRKKYLEKRNKQHII